MPTVLITGVRGKTGAPLARMLLEAGIDVRSGSSDPSGVSVGEPVRWNWDEPATWSDAIRDVDAIYLVRPDIDPAPILIADLLAGVPARTRITLLSERNADLFVPDHWARRVEDVVMRADQPWAILRPSWFMQVFTDARFFRDDLAAGRLPFPSGGAAVAWIDADDIAAVAARTLLDGDFDEAILELTGPEALSLAETAEILGDGLGHHVEYEDVSIEDAVAGLQGFGRRQTAETFERLRDGEFAEPTGDVADVAGRPATSLTEFVRRDTD